MIKLITILESLNAEPRRVTDEENLYLNQLCDELRRAENDAARWHILEREGLNRLDGLGFSENVIVRLNALRRAVMQ